MTTNDIERALGALQFFVNSRNTVRVFEALEGGPSRSRTLVEETGASRSTVARILDEGESLGWIDSEGSRYDLTTEGKVMIAEVRDALQSIRGVQHLGEAIDWLPPPAHSLDYRYFRDADILTGIPSNPTEPFDFVTERIRAGDEIRTLAWTGVPRITEFINQQASAGKLTCEAVMKASFFESLDQKPAVVPHWRAPAKRGEVWLCPEDVPLSFHIIDETVILWLDECEGEELVVRGVLVTEHPAVRSWAESLYEEYRAASALLDPETLPEQ